MYSSGQTDGQTDGQKKWHIDMGASPKNVYVLLLTNHKSHDLLLGLSIYTEFISLLQREQPFIRAACTKFEHCTLKLWKQPVRGPNKAFWKSDQSL